MLPVRRNCDSHVNPFGTKLLTLCKENDLCILNGRLEEGFCTYYALFSKRPVSSMVDYLITGCDSYNSINEMKILDLIDFSDHCPIKFSINCNVKSIECDKIIWDSSNSKSDLFNDFLQRKAIQFNNINEKLLSEYDINQCINNFTDLIRDISFQCFGKTVRGNRETRKNKSPWFNEDCKKTKANFLASKHTYLLNMTEANKLIFLRSKRLYIKWNGKQNVDSITTKKEKYRK